MASYSFVSSDRTRCPPAKTSVHYGASGLALTEPSVDFDLIIRQQPDRARVCTSRGRDRRNVDPPPIIQLKIREHGSEVETSNYLQNPYFFMCCVLVNAKDDRPCTTPASDCLSGTIVSSLYRLKDVDNQDGGFFVFGDISLRMEGIFRLKFSLFEVRPIVNVDFHREVCHIRSVISQPFQVYSAKNFPGMSQSTFLSRSFSDQGVRIRIRKESRSSSRQTPRGATNDSRSDSGDRDSEGNERMDTEETAAGAIGYGVPNLEHASAWPQPVGVRKSPQSLSRFSGPDSLHDQPRSPGAGVSAGRDWPNRPRPAGYHPYAPVASLSHQSSSASSYGSGQSQAGSTGGPRSPGTGSRSPFWNQPRDGRDLSSYSLNRKARDSPGSMLPALQAPSGYAGAASASSLPLPRPAHEDTMLARAPSWHRSEPPTPTTVSNVGQSGAPGYASGYASGPSRYSSTLPSPVSPAFAHKSSQMQHQPPHMHALPSQSPMQDYRTAQQQPHLQHQHQQPSRGDDFALAPMRDRGSQLQGQGYNDNGHGFPRPEPASLQQLYQSPASRMLGPNGQSPHMMPPRAGNDALPQQQQQQQQQQQKLGPGQQSLPPPVVDHMTTRDVSSGRISEAAAADKLSAIRNKQQHYQGQAQPPPPQAAAIHGGGKIESALSAAQPFDGDPEVNAERPAVVDKVSA